MWERQPRVARSPSARPLHAGIVLLLGCLVVAAGGPGCSRAPGPPPGADGGGAGTDDAGAAAGGAAAAGGSAAGGSAATGGGAGGTGGAGAAGVGGPAGATAAAASVSGSVKGIEGVLGDTARFFDFDDVELFRRNLATARKQVADLRAALPKANLEAARRETALAAVAKVSGLLDAAETKLKANVEATEAEFQTFARESAAALQSLRSSTAGVR